MVDDAWDILSITKRGPNYGGGVEYDGGLSGGSGGQRLRWTKLGTRYSASCFLQPFQNANFGGLDVVTNNVRLYFLSFQSLLSPKRCGSDGNVELTIQFSKETNCLAEKP